MPDDKPTGSRSITLDPLLEHDLTLTAKRVESALAAGLRMSWITGGNEDEGVEFDLSCGAGVGSPYMILSVTKDGETRYEVADVRTMLQTWVNAVLKEPSPPWWTGQYPVDAQVDVYDHDRWYSGRVTASGPDGLLIEGPRIDSRSLHWTISGDEIPKHVRRKADG